MSGVVAVTTTGIYCRPECTGRPHERNTRRYPFAAAAEAAGYRACLRCRPYRLQPPVEAVGSALVCRAVALIVDGALDDAGELALAARLGVSARHLRRLFDLHLGLTPDQLARSRRAHFARRLLDDTDLDVTEVAYAAGFGSVRQFNRACRDVFRAAPTELRARRRAHDRLAADGGLTLRLPFTPPLDWERMLAGLAARAVPGVEAVAEGVYRRTVLVDGDPGVLEMWRGGVDHLLLRAHLPHWGGLIHVVQRARHIASLDTDAASAHAHLARDPLLAPFVSAAPARPLGAWDAFEVGVRIIVGQQVSVAAATTLSGRIAARAGPAVAGLAPMGLSRLFPTPRQLAGADLAGLGLTGARSAAVRGFAAAVANGEVVLEHGAELDVLVPALRALPGVGEWTAHTLALRLGAPDAFPAADLGIRRALAARLQRPVSAADATAFAEPWRPWRAWAATQLWNAA